LRRPRSKRFRKYGKSIKDINPESKWTNKAWSEDCGKHIYLTWNDVNKAMLRAFKRGTTIRSYWCKLCNGYHLTSQEKEYWKNKA